MRGRDIDVFGLIGVAALAAGLAGWLGAAPDTATIGGGAAPGIKEEQAADADAAAGSLEGREEEPQPGKTPEDDEEEAGQDGL